MTTADKKHKTGLKIFCNQPVKYRFELFLKCIKERIVKWLFFKKSFFSRLCFCLWSKFRDVKDNLFNPGYPFELLLAPFPACLGWWNSIVRGGTRESSSFPFPGYVKSGKGERRKASRVPSAKRGKKDKKFLFLYPSGWLSWFVVLYAVFPAIPLYFVSWKLAFSYLAVYFLFFLLVYHFCRIPVLNYIWRRCPSYFVGFIEHVPQRIFPHLDPPQNIFKSTLFDRICGPRRLYKKSRQPINWSAGSQQECYLVLAIADLFKVNKKKSLFWAHQHVKFLVYSYFPVWCSHLLLLFILSFYSFTPWYTPAPSILKDFMLAGLGWAVLSVIFGMTMNNFLKRMERNHQRYRFGSQLARWLPPNIKRGEYFGPSVHDVSLKMIGLVQVATFTIYFFLIRLAGSLNPSVSHTTSDIIQAILKFNIFFN